VPVKLILNFEAGRYWITCRLRTCQCMCEIWEDLIMNTWRSLWRTYF